MASDSARSRGRSPSLLTAAMLAPWLSKYLGVGGVQGSGVRVRSPAAPSGPAHLPPPHRAMSR